MNTQMLIPLPNPSPRLLLAQCCSFSFTDSNLEPQLLSLRATKFTDLLRGILSREGDRWPLLGKPAPARDNRRRKPATDGHEHGGIND